MFLFQSDVSVNHPIISFQGIHFSLHKFSGFFSEMFFHWDVQQFSRLFLRIIPEFHIIFPKDHSVPQFRLFLIITPEFLKIILSWISACFIPYSLRLFCTSSSQHEWGNWEDLMKSEYAYSCTNLSGVKYPGFQKANLIFLCVMVIFFNYLIHLFVKPQVVIATVLIVIIMIKIYTCITYTLTQYYKNKTHQGFHPSGNAHISPSWAIGSRCFSVSGSIPIFTA